ncbi:AAR2 domain-containing protein [Lophium mytilinum]|uniref:AAR2 domain-containing protein n=1 Tax=Lophium mytilinum TaxID=390894 RepID=A0A6A6R793_9PEZI|nr:AAR2 domain-containing protein [Lophium mytilinum]
MDSASHTACVLFLDLPPSALGGIDLLSFTTTPRFKGIKNLTPGWHFAFTSSSESMSVRHGAWFFVNENQEPAQIFIKKWDPATEDFVAEQSETEVMRWRANLGSIWRDGLTPYRQSSGSEDSTEQNETQREGDWKDLTSRITPALLSRITGSMPDHWSLTSASSAAQDVDDIPGLAELESKFQPEKELHLLPIDLKKTWREGATGRERTTAAQDRSWALENLITERCSGSTPEEREREIVGELQFAFLTFLTLNNNSCLEQWKRLLELLFTSRQAIKNRPDLFKDLLQVLRIQLSHCQYAESGLFDMTDQGGGFLKGLLRKFRKGLEELDWTDKDEILEELVELEEFLKDAFGWELDDSFVKRGMLELEDGEKVEMEVNGFDEDDESGEYAPVVVDLTPAQIRALQGGDSEEEMQDIESEDDTNLEDMDARY